MSETRCETCGSDDPATCHSGSTPHTHKISGVYPKAFYNCCPNAFHSQPPQDPDDKKQVSLDHGGSKEGEGEGAVPSWTLWHWWRIGEWDVLRDGKRPVDGCENPDVECVEVVPASDRNRFQALYEQAQEERDKLWEDHFRDRAELAETKGTVEKYVRLFERRRVELKEAQERIRELEAERKP